MLVQVEYDGLVKCLVKSVSSGAVMERKERGHESSARQSRAFIPTWTEGARYLLNTQDCQRIPT